MNEKRMIALVSYLYLLFPIAIFFIGWTKIYFALPICLLLLYSLIKVMKDPNECWMPERSAETYKKIIIVLFIIFLWVILSGIGAVSYQTPDHFYRNEIFNILVSKQWPVIEMINSDGNVGLRGLVYYIGFWLPAAVFGKMFGLEWGYLFQIIWAILGITLVYYYICMYRKKLSVWPLLLFISFSGMDIVGWLVISGGEGYSMGMHLEDWMKNMQFSSFTTQLFWVYNQAIYAWLILCMIWKEQDNKRLILLWSTGLLFCTLPFIGMLPFLIYKMIVNITKQNSEEKKKRLYFNGLFSVENVVTGGLIGIISCLYLFGNAVNQIHLSEAFLEPVVKQADSLGLLASTAVNGGITTFLFTNGRLLIKLLFFLFIEIGLIMFAAYKKYSRNVLYYIVGIILLLCPLVKVGWSNDFCMRASIPALFVLYMMIVETWDRSIQQKDKKMILLLSVIVLLGVLTPLHEINRSINSTINNYNEEKEGTGFAVDEEAILFGSNFSADASNGWFYEYIAR